MGSCGAPTQDTLAKHVAETAMNSGNFGKPRMGERGLLESHELNDLRLVEAAKPMAVTKEQRRSLGQALGSRRNAESKD